MFTVKLDSNQLQQIIDAINAVQNSNADKFSQQIQHLQKIILINNAIFLALLAIIAIITITALWKVMK